MSKPPSSARMKLRRLAMVLALTFSLVGQARAQLTSTNIDFSELPYGTIVDGLTIQNVMFNYFVDGIASSDAIFGSVGPCLTFLCGGALEGVAGTTTRLRMTFLTPMWYFEFSLARETLFASHAYLTLFGPDLQPIAGGGPLELWNEEPLFSWAEGEFALDPDDDPQNYLGAVEISFAGGNGRFWIDDIEGEHAPISVPEPVTLLLILTGVLGLGFVSYRRRDRELS